jgi:hypothetical protein
MVYDGPLADHAHEYVLPATGSGLASYLAVCRLCSATKTFPSMVLPGGAGISWTAENEKVKRARWVHTGAMEID